VRANAVPSLHCVASYLRKKAGQVLGIQQKVEKEIFPQIVSLMRDPHFRVRIAVCRSLDAVCEAFSRELVEAQVLPEYLLLLRDSELEVQIEAIKAVQCFAGRLDQAAIAKQIIPFFFEVLHDPDQDQQQRQPRGGLRGPDSQLERVPGTPVPRTEEQRRKQLLLKRRPR